MTRWCREYEASLRVRIFVLTTALDCSRCSEKPGRKQPCAVDEAALGLLTRFGEKNTLMKYRALFVQLFAGGRSSTHE